MSIAAAGQREWEGGLMLGEIRAKERKILADLASLCVVLQAPLSMGFPRQE